jgi:hypothetical protein
MPLRSELCEGGGGGVIDCWCLFLFSPEICRGSKGVGGVTMRHHPSHVESQKLNALQEEEKNCDVHVLTWWVLIAMPSPKLCVGLT